MLAEFSLGRGSKCDTIGAFQHFSPGKKWWLIGALAVLSSYLIASYYMVVAGWTLEYLVESITGGLYEGVSDTSNLEGVFTAKMDEYIATDLRPLLYTYALIAINIGVLFRRCERWYRATVEYHDAASVCHPGRDVRSQPDAARCIGRRKIFSCTGFQQNKRRNHNQRPWPGTIQPQPRHGCTYHILIVLPCRCPAHQDFGHGSPVESFGSRNGRLDYLPGSQEFQSRRPAPTRSDPRLCHASRDFRPHALGTAMVVAFLSALVCGCTYIVGINRRGVNSNRTGSFEMEPRQGHDTYADATLCAERPMLTVVRRHEGFYYPRFDGFRPS